MPPSSSLGKIRIVVRASPPGLRTVASFTRQGLEDKLEAGDWTVDSTHERTIPMRIGPLTYHQTQHYAYVVPRATISSHD